MKITRDFVIQNLADSGLMSADDASSLCESLSSLSGPADSDTVAQELSGTDKLTAYQAECVCRGETSGLLFGDYVVLEKIGQGGMGVVLKAQHTRMERIVAVKKLTAAALESEDLVKRFYREVKASARLLHPNVVTALDAREHEGVHYLIMEFIEGEDLADVLKRQGPLPVDEAVDYVVQAAAGTLRLPAGRSTFAGERLQFALPTEAQWEYACRAGTTTFWHDGDTEASLRESGWYNANSGGKTHPVGQLKASAWGLYDMHGNVWEWCLDWYHPGPYKASPRNDPSGARSGSVRVHRGGSWSNHASLCRLANRLSSSGSRYNPLGLRPALVPASVSGE